MTIEPVSPAEIVAQKLLNLADELTRTAGELIQAYRKPRGPRKRDELGLPLRKKKPSVN